MDELEGLEKQAASQMEDDPTGSSVRTYRWRPVNPELPALYNWMAPSPFEWKDTHHGEDLLNLSAFIVVRRTDVSEHMALLEGYVDVFREVVDPALRQNQPLNGTATWVDRLTMQPVEVQFNDVPAIGFEFGITARMRRQVRDN